MGIRSRDRGEKDLFGQIQIADKKIRKKTRFLLPRLKNEITLSYENIIFIVIAFIMSCIIFFSLGVEKGRHDIGRQVETAYSRGATQNPPAAEETYVEDTRPVKEERKTAEYIIQLAAFTKIPSANEEAERLKLEGYNVSIKKTGSYYQLYIGGFKKRKTAERAIKKLKEKYSDCYILKR